MVAVTIHLPRIAGRGLAFVLGFVLVGALARDAQAETPTIVPFQPAPIPDFSAPGPQYALHAQAAPPVLRTRQWYGLQIMGADAVAIALMFSGAGTPVGGLGFFAAPPAIHGVHHNVPMAIASPIMRSGLALVGGVIGASAEDCSHPGEDSFCGLGGALAGAGIGLLTAMILDYSLAWQDVEVPSQTGRAVQPAEPSRQVPRISLTTAGVAPTTNGASLVLGGRF